MATPVILDEDTYTEAISLIIERDFFPNLAKMRAQQNYLQAQNHGSLNELHEAGKALHNVSLLKKGIYIYNKMKIKTKAILTGFIVIS